MHPLDRPVWNALTSRQAHLALGEADRFLRFPANIEPFGAARDNDFSSVGMAGDGRLDRGQAAGRDAAPGVVRAPEMAVHIPVTCARPEACGIVRAGS